MRIIISDGCYLRSLIEASLCEALIYLPYKITIPDVVFEDSSINLCEAERSQFLAGGAEIVELPGDDVLGAISLMGLHPCMTVKTSFSFLVATKKKGRILLTDDTYLESLARKSKVVSNGILWLLNEIYESQCVPNNYLLDAISIFEKSTFIDLSKYDLGLFERRFNS